jgi:hypothetical protein
LWWDFNGIVTGVFSKKISLFYRLLRKNLFFHGYQEKKIFFLMVVKKKIRKKKLPVIPLLETHNNPIIFPIKPLC